MPSAPLSSEYRQYGEPLTRWDSTTQRVSQDDPSDRLTRAIEMDGAGLHEREDWPLAGNAGAKSLTSALEPSPTASELENNAVKIGFPNDGRASAHMVSKITDKDENHMEGATAKAGASTHSEDVEDVGDEIRETVVRLPYSNGNSGISQDTSQLSDQSPPSSPDDDLYSASPLEPNFRRTPLPSEDRAEANGAFAQDSQVDEHNQDTDSLSDSERPDEQGSAQEQSRSRMPSLTLDTHDTDFRDEARDIATPIPFNSLSDSTSSAASNTPLSNGNLTPPTRARHQSPRGTPATTPSRRSFGSPYQSSLISFNQERVRYSWQSVQEEEPNRPRIHIVKLVSNTTSASAGFPGGEALQFSISSGGRRIAAYNSARLYILQTPALPVGLSQDYALKRRPHAVEVGDDGDVLAILADEHTINIYALGFQKLRRTRTIKLDFPTNCIALAPTGGLVAAAYEGGVEIFSLAASALPTDRRAVRSQRMDRMSFSEDSSTLLGTTTRINASSTVIVTVPVFPSAASGLPTHEELKEAWCADLLHPENIRNSSHATFMREARTTSNDRLFAWNGLADTFGILNVPDLQYGNIDFPVVISPPLSTCGGLGAAIHSCPAIDENGSTVAMIVNDRTIRLYIVPPRSDNEQTTVEAHSIDHELDEDYGCPFSEVRWVHSSSSLPAPLSSHTQVQGRLIVASPGGVLAPTLNLDGMGEESIDEVEGGRIIIFDFDPQFIGQQGQTFSLTLGKATPQTLEEAEVDVAEEVALMRRRTVNQRKGGGLIHRPVQLGRAASTFGGRDRRNRPNTLTNYTVQNEATRSLPDLVEGAEALDAFEEPYQPNAPRSQASLHRAATNAQRHRFQALEERNQEQVSVESNGNFLPLPEYTEEPNAPLPSRYRALAGLDQPAQPPMNAKIVTNTNGDQEASPNPPTPQTAPPDVRETFTAESAFATANEELMQSPISANWLYHSYLAQQQQEESSASQSRLTRDPTHSSSPTGSSPVSFTSPPRTATFDSLGPLPKSLQRAYGNAPTSNSDSGPQPGRSVSGQRNRPQGNSGGNSASLLNPLGHSSPNRASSSASSAASTVTPTSTSARMFPPHLQTFRNTASSPQLNSSQSQGYDPIPLRQPVGSAAHPVTGWHPPAPSSSGPSSSGPFPSRGHSRKSSLANKSAFASTDKARKLGFFRSKSTKRPEQPAKDPFAADFVEGGWKNGDDDEYYVDGAGGESFTETKSVFTMMTRGDGKCSIM